MFPHTSHAAERSRGNVKDDDPQELIERKPLALVRG
jgi:hypothetical protein